MSGDGVESNDWFGRSPAGGDFNGDGFDDLAIGAWDEDVGTARDAGAVNVIYGSACGLQADPTCGNPDDQYFTQGSDGVQDKAEQSDHLGRATLAMDFNGDGFADLAIGAYGESLSLGAVDNAGAVSVIYGSACGLQADPTCGNPDDQFWTQDTPGVKDKAEDRDNFGKNLGGGDFNGDGIADLAVGVWWENLGALDSGMFNLIYGSACGLQADPTCGNPDDMNFAQGHRGMADQAENWDNFGWIFG
jgi:hypothetical protein